MDPITTGVVFVASKVVTTGLGIIGFAATGPVAGEFHLQPHYSCIGFKFTHAETTGTVAAAWQASIGNVAAGSLYAACQSVAMTGWL